MKHLSIDERLRLVEAQDESRHPHLAVCEECRREVAALRAVVRDSRAVDVPEPSPLFWDHFSTRVAEAVHTPPAEPRARWRAWRGWRLYVPLAVGAMALVLAAVLWTEREGIGPSSRASHDASAPAAESVAQDVPSRDEDTWEAMTHLAGDFDLETVSQTAVVPAPGAADSAVWQLSGPERVELTRLLRAELERRPSGS